MSPDDPTTPAQDDAVTDQTAASGATINRNDFDRDEAVTDDSVTVLSVIRRNADLDRWECLPYWARDAIGRLHGFDGYHPLVSWDFGFWIGRGKIGETPCPRCAGPIDAEDWSPVFGKLRPRVVGVKDWQRVAYRADVLSFAVKGGTALPAPPGPMCGRCAGPAESDYLRDLKRHLRACEKPPSPCGACGREIPIESRRDARYCSSACRQRGYRVRLAGGPRNV